MSRASATSPATSPALSRRTLLSLAAAAAVCAPALFSRVIRVDPESVVTAAIFGMGVIGASLVLAWAGEAAEEDLGQGLALAILAFIAVVPEYAVDLVLAIKAG